MLLYRTWMHGTWIVVLAVGVRPVRVRVRRTQRGNMHTNIDHGRKCTWNRPEWNKWVKNYEFLATTDTYYTKHDAGFYFACATLLTIWLISIDSWWRSMSLDGAGRWRKCWLKNMAADSCYRRTVIFSYSPIDFVFFYVLWIDKFLCFHSLWSDPNDNMEPDTMSKDVFRRLSIFRNRLVKLGLAAEPLFPKYCAQNQDECAWSTKTSLELPFILLLTAIFTVYRPMSCGNLFHD